MGAWDVKAFDNDTACDWAYGLDEAEDLSLIEATFENLETGGEVIDGDVACEALAACEIVARLRGNEGYRDGYTESVDQWVAKHKNLQPSPQLIARAKSAIDRVLSEDSELAQLWAESDSGDEWRATVEELRGRLDSIGDSAIAVH